MQSESNPPDLAVAVKTDGERIRLVPCLARPDGGFEPISEEDVAVYSPEWHLVLTAVKAQEKITTSLQNLPPPYRGVAIQVLQMNLDLIGSQ